MFAHRGIWLPDGDTHFTAHLDRGPMIEGAGTYQYNKFEAALALCPMDRRRTALDIGAHIWLWSRVMALHFATILAYEPVPEHIECFIRNLVIAPNNHPNARVSLFPVALGSEDGDVLITRTLDNSGNAHVTVNGHNTNVVRVKMRRLDDYVLDHHVGIDFIKIDVEGAELGVIKGAKKYILQHKPVMLVEQKFGHGQRYGYSDTAAVDLLQTWGATVKWIKNGDYCLAW